MIRPVAKMLQTFGQQRQQCGQQQPVPDRASSQLARIRQLRRALFSPLWHGHNPPRNAYVVLQVTSVGGQLTSRVVNVAGF